MELGTDAAGGAAAAKEGLSEPLKPQGQDAGAGQPGRDRGRVASGGIELTVLASEGSDDVHAVWDQGAPPSQDVEVLVEKERHAASSFGFRTFSYVIAYVVIVAAVIVSMIYVAVYFPRDESCGVDDGDDGGEAGHEDRVPLVKSNSANDFKALIGTCIVNCCCSLVVFLVQKRLRLWKPMLYEGREDHGATKKRRVSFGLHYGRSPIRARRVAGVHYDQQHDQEAEDVINKAGLDGWMMLRFYTLCCRILSTLGLALVVILCPCHVLVRTGKRRCNEHIDLLSMFSLDGIYLSDSKAAEAQLTRSISQTIAASPGDDEMNVTWLLWLHAALVWVVVGVAGRFLLRAHAAFLVYRYGWLASLPCPRATTLIVERIPGEFQSDALLRSFFQRIFPASAVQDAFVVKRAAVLERLAAEVEVKEFNEERSMKVQTDAVEARRTGRPPDSGGLRALAAGLERLFVAPMRQGAPLEHFSSERASAESALRDAQGVLHSRIAREDSSVFSSTGFVTFSSRRWAALAQGQRYLPESWKLVVRPAPDPKDIIWKALWVRDYHRRGRKFLGIVLLILLFALWVPITLAVSSFASPKSLARNFPARFGWLDNYERLQEAGAQYGAVLLLKGAMTAMPNALWMIIRCFNLKTGTQSQLYLQNALYMFMVIFVVLAPAFTQSVIHTGLQVLGRPETAFQVLAKLPKASNFFFNFAVISSTTNVVLIMRPVALTKFLVFSTITSAEKAYIRAQDEQAAFFGPGNRMAKAANMMTMTLVFSTIAPLISVFALVYFALSQAATRYLILQAEDKWPDCGGAFWTVALKQIFFGLFLFVAVMAASLRQRAQGNAPFWFALSALALLHYIYSRFAGLQWRSLPLQTVLDLDEYSAKAKRTAEGGGEPVGTPYEQPHVSHHAESRASKPGRRSRWLSTLGEEDGEEDEERKVMGTQVL